MRISSIENAIEEMTECRANKGVEWALIQQILDKFAKADFYVYLRPLDGRYFDGEGTWWSVSVEHRHTPPTQIVEKGPDLLEVLKRCELQMPEREPGYVAARPGHPDFNGWLAPQRPVHLQVVSEPVPASPEPRSAVHARLLARNR